MKNKLLLIGALFSMTTLFGQTNIADARSYPVGSTVTITGVSANSAELGPIRYIQDATGGFPIYGGSNINLANRGNSVTVTGTIKDHQGLLEIDPITSLVSNGPGTEIDAWNINIVDLGENYEGRLVRMDNVTFPLSGTVMAAETNYFFTDGTNTGQFRLKAANSLVGTPLPAGAQSIVGLLSEFNGLYQLLPRNTADIFGYTAPDKKIEVLVNGTPVLNNAIIQIGTSATTPIELKNIGTNDLTVSAIGLTGPGAADYASNLNNGPIAGGGSESGNLTFNTTSNGSVMATLTIVSNDPDVPTFNLTIYGIGANELASEPLNGASNLTFSNVKAYGMSVAYTASTSADGYIVVWKNGSAPTTAPTDGVVYQRGDMVGDSKVAYIGTSSTFKPRGIHADIDYHYAVYAYNGYEEFTNYNQTDVLAGNQSSQGEQIGNYYAGINSYDADLINKLTNLINPHTVSSYFMYKGLMMDNFEVRDTTGGDSYVVCCYSAERKVFSGAFDWSATGYSREHTFPHSWYPSHPANTNYGQEKPEYLDYHNLYPINQVLVNEPRGNLPLGVVVNVVQQHLDGKRGTDSKGKLVYEPTNKNKGNAARSKFYMVTAYNGKTGHAWKLPSNQDQDLLKEWHFADLPDNYEIARNELIYSIQNNRNPYIDSVDFACYVDFHNMTYEVNGCEGLGLTTEFVEGNLSVFPNPSNEIVYVQLNGVEITSIDVRDMTGRKVGNFKSSTEYVEIDVTNFKAGTYLLNINTEKGNLVKRIIVQ